jgi:autotransporter-associated beta strand protein
VLAIGRYGAATGEVTVAGGLVDMGSGGAVWMGRTEGTTIKISSRLVLTGTGVLRTKQIFEHTPGLGVASQIIFDGGTLKASGSGALVYDVDDVRLTTNGMVIDSAGFNVSVATALQDAAGQAGGITKKGAGTLTLAGTRAATGPVSVLGGTLVASNGLAVAAGTSRIDGTLTLTAANRLTVGAGAGLAGTGAVARVTLQDNAVFARAKADNAVNPITVSDCVADNRLTVALTGYALADLKTPVALMRTPTAFMDKAKIAVTLNGQTSAHLTTKFVEVDGQQVLYAFYSAGTMLMVW